MIHLAFLLPLYAISSPLSYQQIAKFNLTGGYHSSPQFFIHQQALLSQKDLQLHTLVQCTQDHCDWQQATLGMMPHNTHLQIGYNKRFQSHTLARTQPFFGLTISSLTHSHAYTPAHENIVPWLGLVIPKNSLVTIKDASSILQQDTLASGSHFYDAPDLPTGAYPVQIETIDQTKSRHHEEQFVNNVSLSTPQYARTFFSIGLPTKKPAAETYGLPPINNNLHHLLMNLSHLNPTPFGSTQGTINLQKQQLSLGLNLRTALQSVLLQPELLWMHGLFDHRDQHNLAIGIHLQSPLFQHTQWRFLATTYPHQTSPSHIPWIVHSQIQYDHQRLISALMLYVNENPKKNMLQAIVKKRFSHPLAIPDLSLSASARKSQRANLSLNFSIQQKSLPQLSWRLKTTNQQHSVTASISPKKNQKHKITLANLNQTPRDDQRISVSTQWQNAFAIWRLASSTSLRHDHSTWSLQAKTGLLCTGACAIWTPIHSIQTPAIIDIDPSTPPRAIYWGSLSQLDNQGVHLRKKRPFTQIPNPSLQQKHPIILYPGNIVINQTPSTLF